MSHNSGEPLRVLLFEPYSHVLYGNQRDVLTIAKHAEQHSFHYTFVLPLDGILAERLRALGACIIVKPPPKLLRIYGQRLHTGSVFFTLRVVAAVATYNLTMIPLLLRTDPHVIQCHNLRAVLSVGFAAKLLGIPLVWYVKGDLGPVRLVRVAFALSRRVLFLTAGLLTDPHAATLRRYGPRTEVIATSIDLEEVFDRSESDGVPPNGHGCRFIAVAALLPDKGIHVLLHAFAELLRDDPNMELWLAGDSTHEEYKATLHSLVAELRLGERVVFWGWRPDVPALVRAADVMVLPSFTEGVPRAILEAMALSKPVIATRVGGVPDLIEVGTTGLLVPPGDARALAEAMRLLAGNGELRRQLGAFSLQRVQRFSIHTRLSGLRDVYQQVLRGENAHV